MRIHIDIDQDRARLTEHWRMAHAAEQREPTDLELACWVVALGRSAIIDDLRDVGVLVTPVMDVGRRAA